ncbi:hypothetical protein AWC06_00740 [Mycobacterium fragae]|uniref:Uncharacterized protein n=1 Tax=Mycobacterium fragae TaxID=1260918 RepID=A0A1X1UIV7_9MYCO|nr:hypothetical protein AWC06_00740 [Mycobacterium fragae]
MTTAEDGLASIEEFLMGTLRGAVKLPRAAVERKEPRCRICRDESVRTLVNELLNWHGAPIGGARGRPHAITYADILRELEPLNAGRDERRRITYDCLWVHAKRHYDFAGIAAYWRARTNRLLGIPPGNNRI